MSKTKNLPRRAFILALSAILWWASAAPAVRSQVGAQQPATAATAVNAKSTAVSAATTEVLRETSKIRQLEVLREVNSGTQSRAEIERMLIRNLDENSSPAELRASELALKKLGLAPADFQFRPFVIKLLTEQVAGYYDPKTRFFYLADWIDADGQKPVMAHELTHALQDQHFDLRRFEKWPKGDSDAELAAHALVEGDAMLTMSSYVLRNPAVALAMLKSMGAAASGGASSSEQLDRAPRALRETLLFPYQYGLTFATQVHRRGEWALLSAAYKDLPQSTEQVLHAEKYFAREAPHKIELPDLAGALGTGWKQIDYDVNGEWSYYLILDEYLKNEGDSRKAAAGWGGDRYAIYEHAKTGAVMLAQNTVWDTEEDAREFVAAYSKRTELRYKGATQLGAPLGTATELRRAWRTSEGVVLVDRRGPRVVILEGVPDSVHLMILKWIWTRA